MTTPTYEQRVQRGVTILDTWGPDNWWEVVDLPRFDIGNTCDCVLGQVFAPDEEDTEYDGEARDGFERGCDALHLSHLQTMDCGFDAYDDLSKSMDEVGEDYKALQAEWERVINERKGN